MISGDLKAGFSRICIDSRKIHKKEIFVAIKGENYDGHTFIHEVVDKGVRGIVINKKSAKELINSDFEEKKMVCIAVEDTTKALGDIGGFNRRRCDIAVIAVTGSNGKTSTRKMMEKTAQTCSQPQSRCF